MDEDVNEAPGSDRPRMVSAVGRSCIYGALAAIYVGSLWYDVAYQPRLGHNWYLYKAVMLTNLNFLLITAYAVLNFVNCFLKSTRLKAHLDFSFYTAVFPIGLCTVFMFWSLYFFDPDFVMPEWIRNLIPGWLNHVTHTLPLIYTIIDAFLTRHESPSYRVLFAFAVLYVGAYWALTFFFRWYAGYWLYPIFQLLTPTVSAFIIPIVMLLFFFNMTLALLLNWGFWGKQRNPTPKTKTR